MFFCWSNTNSIFLQSFLITALLLATIYVPHNGMILTLVWIFDFRQFSRQIAGAYESWLVVGGRGNRSTRWKPSPNRKSLATFSHARPGFNSRSGGRQLAIRSNALDQTTIRTFPKSKSYFYYIQNIGVILRGHQLGSTTRFSLLYYWRRHSALWWNSKKALQKYSFPWIRRGTVYRRIVQPSINTTWSLLYKCIAL